MIEMAKDDPDYYTYEMKKSLTGSFMKQCVAIRPSWISRARRYAGATGLDIKKIYQFIKKGLYDARIEGFNQKALANDLTPAQQWVLMYLILETGVPEWIRKSELDEEAPMLLQAEPEDESKGVVQKTKDAATSVANTAANVVTIPVRTAKDLVTGAKKAERGAPNPDSPFTNTEE